ncbi:MAG: hypothetical protein ACFFDH_00305 [Promethearchaeota archaeon]
MMPKNDKKRENKLNQPLFSVRDPYGGKLYLHANKNNKWDMKIEGKVNLSRAGKKFFESLLVSGRSYFDNRIKMMQDISFIGTIMIDGREYVVRVQNGQKTIDGKSMKEFFSNINKWKLVDFIIQILNKTTV